MEIKTRQIHDLKMEGDEGDIVVAFAQIGAVDEDEDYTFPGAFRPKTVALSAYQHGSWAERGGKLPTGKGRIEEIDGWAVLKGRFFTETDHGRQEYLTVKAMGEDQQWSYGFDITATAPPPTHIKAKRGLKTLETHEVSPVLLGAQPTAHTMAMKDRGFNEELGLLAAYYDIELTDLKGLPLAGETFDAHIGRMLTELDDFKTRASGLVQLRLKEGRAISTARLEQFQAHAKALLEAHKSFIEVIAAATPKPTEDASAKLRRMRMEAQLGAAAFERTH